MTAHSRRTTVHLAILLFFLAGCPAPTPVHIVYRAAAPAASSPAGAMGFAIISVIILVSLALHVCNFIGDTVRSFGPPKERKISQEQRHVNDTTPRVPKLPPNPEASPRPLELAQKALAARAYTTAYCIATKFIDSAPSNPDARRIRNAALSKLAQAPACDGSDRAAAQQATQLRRAAIRRIGEGDYKAALCDARKLLTISPNDEQAMRIERAALRHVDMDTTCAP